MLVTVHDRQREVSDVDGRDVRPSWRAETSAFPLDDELVVYDADSGRSYVLNPTAACIWELCDGLHSLPAIAQQLCVAFAIPYERALDDVRELIDDFHAAGLLAAQ